MNAILTNKDYEKGVCESLKSGTSLTKWWNHAVAEKVKADYVAEFGVSDNVFDGINVKNDTEAYAKELKQAFLKLDDPIFVSIKPTKKKKVWCCGEGIEYSVYRLQFADYSISLSFNVWSDGSRPILYYYSPISTTQFYITRDVDTLASWLLRKNEVIKAFHVEWEEHCKEMRKRILLSRLDKQVVKNVLSELMGGTSINYEVSEVFSTLGSYIEMSCPNSDLLFRIPCGCQDWMSVVTLFSKIAKEQI